MSSPSVVELEAGDLNRQGGVPCPNPRAGMPAWNSHPRVFLDPSSGGQAQCPYCGTVYRLRDGAAGSATHSRH